MGGLETYVKAIVPELLAQAPGIRFSVFCSPGGAEHLRREEWSGEVRLVTYPLIGARGTKAITEMTLLGVLAGRDVDLLHNIAFTGPLRTRAVNVVMVPDVIWIVAPDEDHAATMRLWRLIVPRIARRADRLITISSAAADDIVEYIGVPREQIDVVPLGPGTAARAAPTPEPQLRAELGLSADPIVLAVSAKKVHKNLSRLIQAMRLVVERAPAQLVLPGTPTEHEQELRRLAGREGLDGRVSFPPYVGAEQLEGLYAAASCFVLPSLNEGFGLPILEAMRRGVPVACSNTSAMPEVAGDAAVYFDPLDPTTIAAAVLDVLGDPTRAAEMVRAGLVQARSFSWARTASLTLESYARAWHRRVSS